MDNLIYLQAIEAYFSLTVLICVFSVFFILDIGVSDNNCVIQMNGKM